MEETLEYFYISRRIPPMNTKTKRLLMTHEVTSVVPTAGQQFSRYFEGHLEFFDLLQYVYVFISRFVAERQTMFVGTRLLQVLCAAACMRSVR